MNGHVTKKGDRYYVVLELSADPETGRRRRKWHSGFAKKADAKEELVRLLNDAQKGVYIEPTKLTVREFVDDQWLPGLERGNLRPGTVEMYRRSVKNRVLPDLGDLRLRDVTPARLSGWLGELKADGVGDRTVEIAYVTAHKLLKSAVDLELLPRNPADNSAVREARPKSSTKEPTVWTLKQTKKFLDSQRKDRLFALWRLATMTGLRRGELAGLRWADVDLDAGVLAVNVTRTVVGYEIVESEPKTEKSKRTIGLDPATVTALKVHRRKQAQEKMAHRDVWTETDCVFVDELGVPYHPQRFTQMLAARAKAAKLPIIRLHALRHGHATAALEAGVPLKVVSERLGHASIAITGDVYSHVRAAVDQAAALQVAAAIDGGA